jgi:hypothetical protein
MILWSLNSTYQPEYRSIFSAKDNSRMYFQSILLTSDQLISVNQLFRFTPWLSKTYIISCFTTIYELIVHGPLDKYFISKLDLLNSLYILISNKNNTIDQYQLQILLDHMHLIYLHQALFII